MSEHMHVQMYTRTCACICTLPRLKLPQTVAMNLSSMDLMCLEAKS